MGRVAIAVVVAGMLVAGYVLSFALGQSTPDPHDLAVAIVTSDDGGAAADRVERVASAAFRIQRVAGVPDARRLLAAHEAYVALIPGASPKLLTANAAGRAAVQAAVVKLPKAAGIKAPQVEEAIPLSRNDPQDTAMNFQVFPLVIFGVVFVLLVTILAPELTVRRRLLGAAGFAIVAGSASVLILNVVLDAIPGSFIALTSIAALTLLAISLSTTALTALLGPPGVTLAIAVFLIIGNAASGAGVQRELLPAFYRAIGRWLPPGSCAEAMRNIAYFPSASVLRPVLVLAGFAACAGTISLALGDRRPAAKGDPNGPTADQGSSG